MAIAFVQIAQDGPSFGVTSQASPSFTATTGNLLVVGVSNQGSSVTGVADNASNTYAQAVDLAGGNHLEIWYAYNITGNASLVVTATFAGSCDFTLCSVREFSGVRTASDPLDDADAANADSTPTLTIPTADSVIYVWAEDDGRDFEAASGYTIEPYTIGGGYASGYFVSGYKLNATGDQVGTITNAQHICAAVFAPAALAAPSGNPWYAYSQM